MPAASTIQHQQLLSNEVQEIISYQPHWIIRKGNLLFFFVFVFILATTFFIQYPDIIRASGRLAAIDGPKHAIARTDGKIEQLLVSNEENVVEGQPLAFLQSNAKHNEVLLLNNWITSSEKIIAGDSLQQFINAPLPLFFSLGELQADYEQFRIQWKELRDALGNGYYQKKQQAVVVDLNLLQQQREGLLAQNSLLDSDFVLQQQEYKAKELLTSQKVLAPLELNQEKGKLLQKKQGLEQMNSQLLSNSINSHNKTKELLELDKYVFDLKIKFQSALFVLKANTQEWIKQFVITAPQSGQLYYTGFLQENQFVSSGTELFFVQPLSSNYYAELKAGQAGIGKLALDQKVLLYYDGYPSEEFGYLTGKLSYISPLPGRSDSFLVKVELPSGSLITNRGKQIYFRNNLHAKAEVITNNRRLIERFTGKLYEMIKR
ncbi:HlyD family efflux transporter periplasmic adaptor subunit [Lacibacter sp.]|uniref:HlyD family efflux transporter periplasmic adaptor subunit n=1 Tax=Lacibacter sp. TaxID=1915409 RepID=UPI002B4AF75F|nr:HlyD family efflux transporter periplasmic adaptor subunit [Lacibacter sp.]HLP39496.1 HlyD family efflux transporter periplasmic adaptor subunit [Lacibacter sp.]